MKNSKATWTGNAVKRIALFAFIAVSVTATWIMGSTLREPSDPSNAASTASDRETPRFSVTIRKPLETPTVELGESDTNGQAITAACSTCHSSREANVLNRVATDLKTFHQVMSVTHGTVTCLSCHNANDYDTLALADGTAVEYADVMQLCGQCHGPQTRDYEHGAHGGMTGYWDLNRGPRKRNNCVDCHDPHAPSFPHMNPTFKPRDRFLEANHHNGNSPSDH